MSKSPLLNQSSTSASSTPTGNMAEKKKSGSKKKKKEKTPAAAKAASPEAASDPPPAAVEKKESKRGSIVAIEPADASTGNLDHPGFIERPHVISKFVYGQFNESKLIEFEGAERCNGSVFIEGISGVGVTATVVSSAIIRELELPLVGVFFSPHITAMAAIHSYAATPPIRIYGDADVCVCVGDVIIPAKEKSSLVNDLVMAITDFARRHRCRHIVTVEGYPIKSFVEEELKEIEKIIPKREPKEGEIEIDASIGLSDDEEEEKKTPEKKKKNPYELVHFVTNDRKMAEEMTQKGHQPIKTGTIVGVSGALLAWSFTARTGDPPLTALLAPDPVKIPDQRGALLAVELLRDIFGLVDLDTSTLSVETKRIADKIHSTLDSIKAQIQGQIERLRPSKPAPSMGMMYM